MAKITAEEYAKVKQATSKYTDEQKQQVVDAYKSWGVSAAKNAIANQRTPSTPVETPKQETTPTTPTPQETPTTTPTAPTSTPTTPKANETVVSTDTNIKQEWALKPLSQEYYNQTSQEAQDKIVANLNWYRQTNPEYFSSYEDFKKNFSYDSRNEQQKNTLDQWYKWYTKGMELSWLPVTDLYTQWKDWTISNSDLENLRISNPWKYAELQNTINKWNIIAAYDDDTGGTETWMSIQDMAYQMMVQTFNQYMNGDSSSWASEYFREYEEKMNDPEMKGLSDQCTEVQEQMENIQSDLDAIKKTVEAEYEGTWASRAKINAIISDRSYDLQLQLRTLNSEYNKYATQYNNRMNQYQNEFNLQLQEYQIQQQNRQQQMQELWFAMDLMNFETNEQKAQREWDYWVKQQEYTNWNINSKDYDTRYKAALKSVQNLLSQYEGIPMQRSAEQMAQDVLKAINNWSDLWTELTKINQQIQQKPEYKQLYNATYGTWSTGAWFWKTIKVWDMEFVEYNWQWYTADEIKQMFTNTWSGTKPYDPVDASKLYNDLRGGTGNNLGHFLIRKLDWQKGGQCWKYVNDYLEYIGMTGAANRYYDDELSTKLNSINTYDPKEWVIAVFDYNHKSSDGINHWHVGIVTKITKDGIYVRDSNYSSDEKIKTRFIAKGSDEWNNNLKWFFDPSQPPMWSSITTVWWESSVEDIKSNLSEQDKQKAEGMLKQIRTWAITPSETSAARDWLIEKWYGDEFLEALDKWIKVSLTDTQKDFYEYGMNTYKSSDIVKDFKTASSQISNLITSLEAENWAWDLAWIFQFMKVLDPRSVVRKEEFEQAAASAWYAKPSQLWQKYLKHGWDGTWLTEAARGNFAELAKNIIKSQAEMYEIEYWDLKQVFENANIDEQWLPTNYAEVILQKLDGTKNTYSALPTLTSSIKSLQKATASKQSSFTSTKTTEQILKEKYWLM